MGMILNPSNEKFAEVLNSEIYIDKSMFIVRTNKVINTLQKYVCVSRPRRFGKSVTADMLCAYYGQEDSASLFAGLKIAQVEGAQKYQNQFHVIHWNVLDYFSESGNHTNEMIALLLEDTMSELESEFPDALKHVRRNLSRMLSAIYAKTGRKFVFVIDEWDCIFRRNKEDIASQTEYLDFLRNLLKDKVYVALAYMTGILPVKKYGEHSALNMFTEISVADAGQYAEFTGFTETEVKVLCDQYSMEYDEVNRWYDGYRINDISVYNPKSVVEAMLRRKIGNYWTQTETYEALKIYIQTNMDGLHEKVEQLIAGEKIEVDITSFQNDMTTFCSADDVLALLIHLGYLTYYESGTDNRISVCWIPNLEVQQEFIRCIKSTEGWEHVMHAIRQSDQLLEDTIKGDEKAVGEALRQLHYENTSLLTYSNENSLSCLINLAYYSARKYYTVLRELETGEGFADVVFIPYKNTCKPAMIVELKYNQNADTAIDQIKEKRYHGALSQYLDRLLIVGINYDKKTKEHSCKIERFQSDGM